MLFSIGIEMPSMPSMPKMPSISADGEFYRPEIPSSMMKQNNNKKEIKNENTENQVQSAKQSEDLFTSLLTNDSTLTANDISSLYSSGLFEDLTSLGGIVPETNYLTTTSTNVLLQQILNQLNELKTKQKNAAPEKIIEAADSQKDSANFKQRNPAILRFRINDFDIKGSLVEVFLSKPDKDGSFLLTGDRKYTADQRTRSETFYFLFKPEKTVGSSVTYKVIPSVVQDYLNVNSFVYKLAQISDLVAEKTGNLVVLRYSGKDITADLLVDLDEQ